MRSLMLSFFFLQPALFAASAASPREELKKLTSQLQASPSDQALRERIIALAAKLKPAPPIPDSAIKLEGRAEYAFKNAQSASDYAKAAAEYEKALLAAPWAAAYYYNQGLAYEKAGEAKKAIQSLELYLMAAPNAQDTREVKKRIGGLEFAAEGAAQEAAAPKAAPPDWSGYWKYADRENGCWRFMFLLNGQELVINRVCLGNGDAPLETESYGKATINGRAFNGSNPGGQQGRAWSMPSTFHGTISDDNARIELTKTVHGEYPPGMPALLRQAASQQGPFPKTYTDILIRE